MNYILLVMGDLGDPKSDNKFCETTPYGHYLVSSSGLNQKNRGGFFQTESFCCNPENETSFCNLCLFMYKIINNQCCMYKSLRN